MEKSTLKRDNQSYCNKYCKYVCSGNATGPRLAGSERVGVEETTTMRDQKERQSGWCSEFSFLCVSG